ncbi:MAG: beta-ketoacyl synthase N-terminal-like domain-containing protein [candidate division FCPU426 bacterium]
MKDAIVITHLGLVHALGDDPQAVFDSLAAGRQGLTRGSDGTESAPVSQDLRVLLGNGKKQGFTRSSLLAGAACRRLWQAWAKDTGQPPAAAETGLVTGFTPDIYSDTILQVLSTREYHLMSPFFFLNLSANATASQVSILLGIQAFILTMSTGHTAGLEALETACRVLSTGRARQVAAGAVQEISARMVRGFSGPGAPPGSGTGILEGWRPGAVDLGEGSAWMFLLRADEARQQGLRPRARLCGFGMAYNPEAAGQGDPRACNQAIAAALADAGWKAGDVEAVFLAANGDPAQDQAEMESMKNVFGNQRPPMTALKGALGETWHAAGAMAAVLAILCLEHRLLLPTQRLPSSGAARELYLPMTARPLNARRAMVMALDQDRKAMACLLELPA